jgi:hypothetical protein
LVVGLKKTVSVMVLMLLTMNLLFSAVHLPRTFANDPARDHKTASLPPIDWDHYHNYSEVVAVLFALNETYPDVVDVFSIGKSWRNRDIYCIRLTNESDQTAKPEVFFVGYHHAREQITSELALYFVVYAAVNFGSNSTVTELLNKSEIYVVVALNVDGFDLFEDNDWQRKNARPADEDYDGLIDEDPPEDENGDGFIEQLIYYGNPDYPVLLRWEGTDNDGDGSYAEDWIGGVDLNRNYDYAWESGSANLASEIYKGPAPFSEPETQAVRDFVLKHRFTYAVSFHSGTELILYPWGYTRDPSPDEARFIEVAQNLSVITRGTPYGSASDLYLSYGSWDDWMYGVADVLPFTCEIFYNDTWSGVVEPGPEPNTFWEGGLRYWFNPFPSGIESTILRWFGVFFYITNRTINEAFHDVAVNEIKLSKTVISEGFASQLNISVQNQGYFPETFNITVYVNSTVIFTQEVTFTNRSITMLNFIWNTTGFSKGNYVITAIADVVSGETDTADNLFVYSAITVTIPGDVDGDFDVDIYDAVKITGVYLSEVGGPRYRSNSDINGDGIIDIYDVVICTSHYGQKYP